MKRVTEPVTLSDLSRKQLEARIRFAELCLMSERNLAEYVVLMARQELSVRKGRKAEDDRLRREACDIASDMGCV